jgi:hypothetical protein
MSTSPEAIDAPHEASRDVEKSERDMDALHGGGGGGGGSGEGAAAPIDGGKTLAELLRAGDERAAARRTAEVKRAVELAKLPVVAADVEFLVREFELEKVAAERLLRLAGGDVKAVARRLAGVSQ